MRREPQQQAREQRRRRQKVRPAWIPESADRSRDWMACAGASVHRCCPVRPRRRCRRSSRRSSRTRSSASRPRGHRTTGGPTCPESRSSRDTGRQDPPPVRSASVAHETAAEDSRSRRGCESRERRGRSSAASSSSKRTHHSIQQPPTRQSERSTRPRRNRMRAWQVQP